MGKISGGINLMVKSRYKVFSPLEIKGFRDEKISLEDIDSVLSEALITKGITTKLAGGKVSNVYSFFHDGQKRVLKISKGLYRINELKREADILRLLVKDNEMYIVPEIRCFKMLDNIGYLIEDFINGVTVREKLRTIMNVLERQDIWEKVGQVLSRIHGLYKLVDKNGEWLEGQLRIAEINMKHAILDSCEFQEQSPEEMLKWLKGNKPVQNKVCLLHGDFRTKNIMIDYKENMIVLDWGFVDVGDPYYDLAIIDYYFDDDKDRQGFYRGYKCCSYDRALIDYYVKMSKFINV